MLVAVAHNVRLADPIHEMTTAAIALQTPLRPAPHRVKGGGLVNAARSLRLAGPVWKEACDPVHAAHTPAALSNVLDHGGACDCSTHLVACSCSTCGACLCTIAGNLIKAHPLLETREGGVVTTARSLRLGGPV
jgi:hypothetical protein